MHAKKRSESQASLRISPLPLPQALPFLDMLPIPLIDATGLERHKNWRLNSETVASFWWQRGARQNGTCGQKLEALEKTSGTSGFTLRWILRLADASVPNKAQRIVELGEDLKRADHRPA
jgi:hypothetical protein